MKKGKIIYHGDIKKLVINSLAISHSSNFLVEKSFVVHKDADFYRNLFGKIISFEYGSVLPSYDEAKDCLEYSLKNSSARPMEVNCLFVDYDMLSPEEITSSDFNDLKKGYKLRKKR